MATNSILSLVAVATIFFSQLFEPCLAQVCIVGKGCNYVDESKIPIKYLMVGNPGTGKSTMLNGLARKPLFQSGLSFNSGKTVVLQREQIGKDWYMDTPGLSDMKLREQAAVAITDALNDGGAYKIIFVLTIEAGRVRPADRTTMELILASAPISYYGVLINKVGKKEHKMLTNNTDGAYDAVVGGLMTGLPTKSLYFHFKPRIEDLADEDDAVPDLDEEFVRFMQNVPAIEILPEEVKDIDVRDYDKLAEKFETVINELANDKKLLQERMEKDKQEYMKMIDEIQQRNQHLMERPEASSGLAWAKDIVPLIPIAVSVFTSGFVDTHSISAVTQAGASAASAISR
jgi:hypothetical protein